MNYLRQNKGFTLVQLIVVVAVITVLTATVIFGDNIILRKGKAQNAQRYQDVAAIGKAIEFYQIDNDALPSDLAGANVNTGQKKVLCSSASSLTCDGQTRDCLVVDDTDFLGKYIDTLPVDPEKTADTDTGYYITRTGTGMMTFGSCTSYDSETITYVAKASLATYTTTCGDGEVEGAEVCDDGNNDVESCGDGDTTVGGCNADCSASLGLNEACDDGAEVCGDGERHLGTYCNDTCTAIDKVMTEACDYFYFENDCAMFPSGWATESDSGAGWCKIDCSSYKSKCAFEG
jgi:type II secretory pathway pseudopilin PulG